MNTKKVLILENDYELSKGRHDYVFDFLEKYDGERIEMTRLQSRTDKEIWVALNECTDILVQTCFVNGSDTQFYTFMKLMKNIKEPKNIYIALLGDSLKEWFDGLKVEDLYAINHHNIYELERLAKTTKLSFAYKIMPELRRLVRERTYTRGGKSRLTGQMVKILNCIGFNKEFKHLPIGETVQGLDMSELDPNPGRGVWVWGNTKPVKLVNDLGVKEYELVGKLSSDEMIEEIFKTVYGEVYLDDEDEDGDVKFITYKNMTRLQSLAFKQVLEDKETNPMEKANIFCEELSIKKRGNRRKIYDLINK